MGDSIDRKYKILAVNRGSGNTHTDKDSILLLAKDDAVPDTLRFYKQKCEELGASKEHIESIELLIGRIDMFRSENPKICKTPDISTAEIPIQLYGDFKD